MINSGRSLFPDQDEALVHASCVALDTKALLILGGSGAGKSSLALSLMSLGAQLVADDRVSLRMERGSVTASSPKTIAGLIEARGLGILNAPHGPAGLAWVVDMDEVETERLPLSRKIVVLRQTLPLFHTVKSPHFAALLMQLMKSGRVAPEWPTR
ncbi:MAG: serine kinase [Pseudomonadota bacterium]